jgi:hypothetical protein
MGESDFSVVLVKAIVMPPSENNRQMLVERQLLINSVRNVHEAIACSAGSGLAAIAAIIVVTIVAAVIAVTAIPVSGSIFALCELNLIYHDANAVNLLTVLVGIIVILNSSAQNNLGSLAKILFNELALLTKASAVEEIRIRLTITLKSSVYGHGKTCYGSGS